MKPRARGLRLVKDGPSVLCLHGFTGTPLSVRPLVQHLAGRGRTAIAPLIAGHGGSVRDLSESDWTQWLASADAALTDLIATQGGPVAIVGYSMGGLLAAELARTRPQDVCALVLMAAPLQLPAWQKKWLRRFRRFLPRWLLRQPFMSWPKFGGPDISAQVSHRADRTSLRVLPIGAANSLLDLAEHVRPHLGEISQPTLLVHSRGDLVIPFAASEELAALLGPAVREFLRLEQSHHLLCYDVDRQQVFDTVEAFLARYQTR